MCSVSPGIIGKDLGLVCLCYMSLYIEGLISSYYTPEISRLNTCSIKTPSTPLITTLSSAIIDLLSVKLSSTLIYSGS